MKSFEVEGISYRSISDFCRKRKVSYWKIRRLCMYYAKAQKSPAQAAIWVLNPNLLNKDLEVKTARFFREKQQSAARQIMYKARKKAERKRSFI